MMKKIKILELYPEVGIKYDITNQVFYKILNVLNSLNVTLPHYDKIFKDDEYTLLITLSAKEKISELVIKGPTLYKKDKQVGFVFFMPYKTFEREQDTMCYIVDNIEQGMIFIFNKYKLLAENTTTLHQKCSELKEVLQSSPQLYLPLDHSNTTKH